MELTLVKGVNAQQRLSHYAAVGSMTRTCQIVKAGGTTLVQLDASLHLSRHVSATMLRLMRLLFRGIPNVCF